MEVNKKFYAILMILLCTVLLIFIMEASNIVKSNECYTKQGGFFASIRTFNTDNQKNSITHFQRNVNNATVNVTKVYPLANSRNFQNINSLETSNRIAKNGDDDDVDDDDDDDDDSQLIRQQRLRHFCLKNRHSKNFVNKSLINPLNMFISDSQGVLYCAVPKVACTNWKRMMLVFEGKIQKPLDIQRKEKVHLQSFKTFYGMNKVEIKWRADMYYSFLFVRHPFERLLSAYRNKFEDPYNTVYQKTYGSKILRLFRDDLTSKQYQAGKNVTFNEFVQYVIWTYEKSGTSLLNEHWQITHALCDPCHFKYSFIGKMETLAEDSKKVLNEVGVDKTITFPINERDKYKTKTKVLMQQYYSQLTIQQIEMLYKIYEVDFEAFGYEIPKYIYSK